MRFLGKSSTKNDNIFLVLVCLLVLVGAAYLSRFTDRLKQLRVKATKGIACFFKTNPITICPEISPSTESEVKARAVPSAARWPEFKDATLKPVTSDTPGLGQPTIVQAIRTW